MTKRADVTGLREAVQAELDAMFPEDESDVRAHIAKIERILAATRPAPPATAVLREAAQDVLDELDIISKHRAKSGVGYLAVHPITVEALRAALAATPPADRADEGGYWDNGGRHHPPAPPDTAVLRERIIAAIPTYAFIKPVGRAGDDAYDVGEVADRIIAALTAPRPASEALRHGLERQLADPIAAESRFDVRTRPASEALPMQPDPNAVEVAPGTFRHWGLYLRGEPPQPASEALPRPRTCPAEWLGAPGCVCYRDDLHSGEALPPEPDR